MFAFPLELLIAATNKKGFNSIQLPNNTILFHAIQFNSFVFAIPLMFDGLSFSRVTT